MVTKKEASEYNSNSNINIATYGSSKFSSTTTSPLLLVKHPVPSSSYNSNNRKVVVGSRSISIIPGLNLLLLLATLIFLLTLVPFIGLHLLDPSLSKNGSSSTTIKRNNSYTNNTYYNNARANTTNNNTTSKKLKVLRYSMEYPLHENDTNSRSDASSAEEGLNMVREMSSSSSSSMQHTATTTSISGSSKSSRLGNDLDTSLPFLHIGKLHPSQISNVSSYLFQQF
jgi:hypothetical protein